MAKTYLSSLALSNSALLDDSDMLLTEAVMEADAEDVNEIDGETTPESDGEDDEVIEEDCESGEGGVASGGVAGRLGVGSGVTESVGGGAVGDPAGIDSTEFTGDDGAITDCLDPGEDTWAGTGVGEAVEVTMMRGLLNAGEEGGELESDSNKIELKDAAEEAEGFEGGGGEFAKAGAGAGCSNFSSGEDSCDFRGEGGLSASCGDLGGKRYTGADWYKDVDPSFGVLLVANGALCRIAGGLETNAGDGEGAESEDNRLETRRACSDLSGGGKELIRGLGMTVDIGGNSFVRFGNTGLTDFGDCGLLNAGGLISLLLFNS